MSGDVCIYPYHLEARGLPVYMTGIGGTAWQQPVNRPEGYFWHQLLLCLGGSGVLSADAVQWPIRAGDVFFLPADCPHAYWPETKQWEVRWIAFDGPAALSLLAQLDMDGPLIAQGGAAALQPIHERMVSEITGDRLQGNYICSGLTYMSLMTFHQQMLRQTDVRSRLMTETLRFIDENYARDLSLGEMAAHAGVTQQHLCRVFREAIRMRPGEYLAQRRVQAAQTLIQIGALPLSEVARQVGFASPGYFSTVFRRYVGMAPGEYRRRIKGR